MRWLSILHCCTHASPAPPCVRHASRPYESGEVIVQPYNTLLTLGHLADLSDGIVLLENEGLHRLATKLMGIARPTFGVGDTGSGWRGLIPALS